MKDTIFALVAAALLVAGLLTSCTPEEVTPTPPAGPDCPSTCGLITDDGIEGECYWIDIRNECSDNIKRFCLAYGDWLNAHPGENFCITNTEPW